MLLLLIRMNILLLQVKSRLVGNIALHPAAHAYRLQIANSTLLVCHILVTDLQKGFENKENGAGVLPLELSEAALRVAERLRRMSVEVG
jgi:hypothetical protein